MKPGSTAFAVNSSGRIFGLRCDRDYRWVELPYLGLDFKRLSATHNSLWALGGDHQIYVCVFGVEIPIRVKEESFENQRWNPMDGFSEKLLPTDRPKFSTIDGLHDRQKDKIKLPTMAWQWESPWYVDTRLDGKQLEKDVSFKVETAKIRLSSLL
jgi:tectonin beta-propeller repeat-containing protein 1